MARAQFNAQWRERDVSVWAEAVPFGFASGWRAASRRHGKRIGRGRQQAGLLWGTSGGKGYAKARNEDVAKQTAEFHRGWKGVETIVDSLSKVQGSKPWECPRSYVLCLAVSNGNRTV